MGDAADQAITHAHFFVLDKQQPRDDCELLGRGLAPQVSVDGAGNLVGSFTAPTRGSFFQQQPTGGDRVLPTGTYTIILGSHPAFLATLKLMSS